MADEVQDPVPPLKVAVHSRVDPIENVTVPVGVGPLEATVADNVTGCPTSTGFGLADAVVVVVLTVKGKVMKEEQLLVSPLYAAVTI